MPSILNSNLSVPIQSNFFQATLSAIVEHFGLTELKGENSAGPFLSCNSRFGLVQDMAKVRVYMSNANTNGSCPIEKLVHIELNCPQIGLASDMLYAFTNHETALPHFTLDVVKRGQTYGLHCDLIPRDSRGTEAPLYFQKLYLPLQQTFAETRRIEGVKAYKLRESQTAVMSPLLLCYLANNASDYAKLAPAVHSYLEQWFSVLDKGIDSGITGYTREQLSENDNLHRAQIFSPKVDPVWLFVRLLIGRKNEEAIRSILCSHDFRN